MTVVSEPIGVAVYISLLPTLRPRPFCAVVVTSSRRFWPAARMTNCCLRDFPVVGYSTVEVPSIAACV